MIEESASPSLRSVKELAVAIDGLASVLSERAACDRSALLEVKKQANLATRIMSGEVLAPLFTELLLAIDRLGVEEPDEELVRSVSEEMLDICQQFGLVRVDDTGAFNPRIHEADSVCSVSDPSQDGMIMRVERAGYILGDQLLRPARVVVGKFASSE